MAADLFFKKTTQTAVALLEQALTTAEQDTWRDAGERAQIQETLAQALQRCHEH